MTYTQQRNQLTHLLLHQWQRITTDIHLEEQSATTHMETTRKENKRHGGPQPLPLTKQNSERYQGRGFQYQHNGLLNIIL